MRAILNNYRQSPRKVRLVADSIKGKTVGEARAILSFLPKAATVPLRKLLESAVANAKENDGALTDIESFRIVDARVDSGATLKRSMPRARGSAYQILKRTSKVTLILAPQELKKLKNQH